jgi:succinyldiaminopimelate transaminase
MTVDFWQQLDDLRRTAGGHPGGMVDLSRGEPIDPVPETIRAALTAAAVSPGYPQTSGTVRLREAAAGWLGRCHGVTVEPAQVLPTVGSKELLGLLPLLLGLGAGDAVALPSLAYPSYRSGADLVGALAVPVDDVSALDPVLPSGHRIRLVWLNSPSNPTGRVLSPATMRRIVAWAQDNRAVVAADECYLDFGWEAQPLTLLAPPVAGGSTTGLLAVHSMSKRSNLAGYRAGLVAGDGELIARLLRLRREIGLITPAPVQQAMVAALEDDDHLARQRERYGRRRALLRAALEEAGWTVDHSEAGLFLWARPGERVGDGWWAAERLARAGILVTPGALYGQTGRRHVRIAVTATDAQVATACRRLTERTGDAHLRTVAAR